MFERYTEGARRVVFRARNEAGKVDSAFIETEHLLLGILEEDRTLGPRLLGKEAMAVLFAQLRRPEPRVKSDSKQVDLPLSHESKRVLAYGAEEAERLNHKHIGPDHLLLGVLREEQCRAAQVLRKHGVEASRVRKLVAEAGLSTPASELQTTKQELHQLVDELPQEYWDAAVQALRALRGGAAIIVRGHAMAAAETGAGIEGSTGRARSMNPMFERYTAKARRTLFFARYEATQVGSQSIESEHLLLGLLREHLLLGILHEHGPAAGRLIHARRMGDIRSEIERRKPPGTSTPTSVDLPLSQECTHALAFAAKEAERLGHADIGNEHLLVGLLMDEKCLASELLRDRGISLEEAQKDLAQAGGAE